MNKATASITRWMVALQRAWAQQVLGIRVPSQDPCESTRRTANALHSGQLGHFCGSLAFALVNSVIWGEQGHGDGQKYAFSQARGQVAEGIPARGS